MALAGDLPDFSLVDLIQLMDLSQKSGGVEIHGHRGGEQFDGWLFFDAGKLRAAQLRDLQGAEAVYTLFTCTAGSFELHEQVALPPRNIHVSNEVAIMEGIMWQEEWSLLEKRAPPRSAVLHLAPNPPVSSREINLQASKWRILTMINGKNTVADITRAAGMGQFATLKLIIDLLDAGLIQARVEEPHRDSLYHDLEQLAVAGIGASARKLLSDALRRIGIQPNDANPQPQHMLQAIGSFEQAAAPLLGPSRARALAEQLRARVHQTVR